MLEHYFYTKWPDHGCPSSASELISFCKMFRSERQKAGGTIIAHCRFVITLHSASNTKRPFISAGVGRTGTFIALDIMIQRLKQEKKINVFDLVKQLRTQRMKMVQTVDQYAFLYASAAELTEDKRQSQGQLVIVTEDC